MWSQGPAEPLWALDMRSAKGHFSGLPESAEGFASRVLCDPPGSPLQPTEPLSASQSGGDWGQGGLWNSFMLHPSAITLEAPDPLSGFLICEVGSTEKSLHLRMRVNARI